MVHEGPGGRRSVKYRNLNIDIYGRPPYINIYVYYIYIYVLIYIYIFIIKNISIIVSVR